MTVKGGTSPACAVCKFQRRRCSSDCQLAPYFPANQMRVFQSVHRLFGVSNIMKTIRELKDNDQRHEAMKSIKYESYIRQIYPVHGCLGVICYLKQQNVLAMRELQYVQAQLAVYRQMNSSPDHSASSHLQLCISTNSPCMNDNDDPFSMNNAGEIDYSESSDNLVTKPLMLFQNYNNNNNNSLAQARGSTHTFAIDNGSGEAIFQAYDEIPFDNLADDRQSYIQSKETSESSSESNLKDATGLMEHESKNNNLITAAACFGLTSACFD